MIIFKNMFSFALTFKAYEWLVTNGTRATPVFNALGAVQVVVCALSVPMCMSPPLRSTNSLSKKQLSLTSSTPDILGKRNRSFFYRNDILKMLNLR